MREGSGSVHQLKSGYDWTRTHLKTGGPWDGGPKKVRKKDLTLKSLWGTMFIEGERGSEIPDQQTSPVRHEVLGRWLLRPRQQGKDQKGWCREHV